MVGLNKVSSGGKINLVIHNVCALFVEKIIKRASLGGDAKKHTFKMHATGVPTF